MRTALLVLPLLVACDASSATFLAEGIAELDPLGDVHLRSLGAVRLTPDGPVAAVGEGLLDDSALVLRALDADERLGVRVDVDDIELLLWVDRADALAWTVGDTPGAAGPGRAPVVSFAAGAPVEILAGVPGSTRALYEGATLRVDAWVASADLDEVLVGPPATPAVALDDRRDLLVALPLDLHDAPDGEWVGEVHEMVGLSGFGLRVDGRPARWLAADGRAVDGWIPVAIGDGVVSLDAWIHGDAVLDPTAVKAHGWGGSRCGGAFRMAWSPRPTARAGALVYDAPDGTQIGEVFDDQPLEHVVIDDPWGWARATLDTPWGPVEVWLEPGEVDWPPSR